MSLLELARALAARSSKARTADAAELAALNEELEGRIPAWYIELLTTVPLCGFEVTAGRKHLQFLDAGGIRNETLKTHQFQLIKRGGYVAIAYDHKYYDTFFLKSPGSEDPPVYQINHEDGEEGVAFSSLSELLTQARPYVEPPPQQGPRQPPARVQLYRGKQLGSGLMGDFFKELQEKLPPDLREVRSAWEHPPSLGDYGYELRIHGRPVGGGTCPDFNFGKLCRHLRELILAHAVELRTAAPEADTVAVAPGLEVTVEGFAVVELPKLNPGHFLVALDSWWQADGRVEPGRLLQYGENLWGPADMTWQGLPARWIDEEDEDRARAAGASVATPEEVVRWVAHDAVRRVRGDS